MNGFELVRRHHIRLIVGIGVFTAIVTQILMQTGGGERDGIFDLGDSLAPFIDSFVFEGFLPSSPLGVSTNRKFICSRLDLPFVDCLQHGWSSEWEEEEGH